MTHKPFDESDSNETALDHTIVSGLRVWMLLAMIFGVLLTMSMLNFS